MKELANSFSDRISQVKGPLEIKIVELRQEVEKKEARIQETVRQIAALETRSRQQVEQIALLTEKVKAAESAVETLKTVPEERYAEAQCVL